MTADGNIWHVILSARPHQFSLVHVKTDNRVNVCIHDTTGCQTRCQQPVVSCIQTFNWLSNPFDNWFDKTAVSCIQPVVKPVVQPGLTTGWMNSGCSFNTVVKLFDNRFDNRYLFTRYSRLSNRLYNRLDNRLYRVNGVLELQFIRYCLKRDRSFKAGPGPVNRPVVLFS